MVTIATLFLALLFTLSNCRSGIYKEVNQIPVIDVASNVKSFRHINLSEVAESIEYISLETNKDYLVGKINDLIITDDRFFVVGPFSCNVFDLQGNFLCNIGGKGNGPGEYNLINRCSVDEENKAVYIFTDHELYEYDYNGNYIQTITLKVRRPDEYWYETIYIADSLFLGTTTLGKLDMGNFCYIFNKNGDVITVNEKKPFSEPVDIKWFKTQFAINNVLIYSGDYFLIKCGYDDTLYYLNNKLKFEPKYVFNFGEYSDPIAKFNATTAEEEHKIILNQIGFGYYLTETNDYVLFNLFFGDNYPKDDELVEVSVNVNGNTIQHISTTARGLYNKQNSDLVFLKNSNNYYGFMNDIDGGLPFWPLVQAHNEQLVSYLEPYDLKMWVKSDVFKNSKPLYSEKKAHLEELTNGLNENDNPVIILLKLKEL